MVLEIDLAGWPVAVLARPAGVEVGGRGGDGEVDVDADLHAAVGPLLGSLLDRRERFGLVLDLGRQTDAQQSELAGWLRDNRVRARRYIVGCALVLPEVAVDRGRELLGARPDLYPFPAWVAATRDECRDWVEGVLASSGPRVGRLRRR